MTTNEIDLLSLYEVINAQDFVRLVVNHGELMLIRLRHEGAQRVVVETFPLGTSGIGLGELTATLAHHGIQFTPEPSPLEQTSPIYGMLRRRRHGPRRNKTH